MVYNIIEVFTREDARWQGKPVHDAIIKFIRDRKMAARVMVSKGVAGCYENGEVSTLTILDLSVNMPVKIEIILPHSELETVLPIIEEMVVDGIVLVESQELRSYKSSKQFLPKHLKVKDVMNKKPFFTTPETNLSSLLPLLLNNSLKWLPVVDNGKHPIGIIAQKELTTNGKVPILLGLASLLSPSELQTKIDQLPKKTAKEIMSGPAVTINEEEYLPAVVRLMTKKNLKRLPVVNDLGELVGIISRLDIFRAIMENIPNWSMLEKHNIIFNNHRTVKEITTNEAKIVRNDVPLSKVAETLKAGDIQRVVIVDKDRGFMGWITDYEFLPLLNNHSVNAWDFFAAIMEKNRTVPERLKPLLSIPAEQIMKREVTVLSEETPLEEAIRLITEKGFKRIPIVDKEGKYKGWVTRDSLLRVLI